MPARETHNPFQSIANDAISSIPTPSDVGGLMRMLGAVGNPNQAQRASDLAMMGQSLPQLPRALLEGIENHPVGTIAGMVGPGAGVGAYRELMPLPLRAYLHQFYGGGRPMTSIPKRLTSRIAEIGVEGPDSPYFLESGSQRDAAGLLQHLEDRGVKMPKSIDYGRHYGTPQERTFSRSSADADAELFAGMGRFFVDDVEKPTRAWDWYEFFPGIYDELHHEGAGRGISFRNLEEIANTRGNIPAIAAAAKSALPLAGESYKRLRELGRGRLEALRGVPSGMGAYHFEPQLAWLAKRFGTPFPIDVEIPR